MFTVPDALAGFYLACFLLGLVFVLVSALIGLGHDALHLPGVHTNGGDAAAHADGGAGLHPDAPSLDLAQGHGPMEAGHAGDHAAAVHVGDGTERGSTGGKVWASPLNLMTVMAFLTWFGAGGYILHAILGWWPPLTLPLSLVPGFVAGWLVYLFLVKVLLPGTHTEGATERQIVGRLGKVSIKIPAGGVGEVVYTLGGARHSDGAVSIDGLEIPQDAEVVIVGFEKGLAQVEPFDRFTRPQKRL